MQISVRLLSATILSLGVAGCFGQKKEVGEYVDRAQRQIASGNKAEAADQLKTALRIAPADPRANLALAKLEDESGDLQAAVPHYLRAATPDARLIEAQLRLVEILIDSDRLQEASGILTATMGAFPDNTAALALRADIAERQNLPSAAADADAVLRKDSGNARASSVLALVALSDKDSAQALSLLDKALAKHPNDIRLLQVQAAALVMANEPDKAIAALRSVSRSAPRDAFVQSALANLQAANGQVDEALEGFKRAVTADPANQDMQLAFVQFLVRNKPGVDVADYLRQRIKEFPRIGTYDLALAGYYRNSGKLDQSEQVLQSGSARLGTEPAAIELTVALARVEADRGQDASAMTLLKQVLTADPANEQALMARAKLNLAAGRAPDAIDDLLSAVRLNPLDAGAFQMLASAYVIQREPKLAIDAMRRAVATQSGDNNAQVKMAAFLQGAGDEAGARGILARLTVSNPGVSAIWIADGQIAIARKDWAEATHAVKRLKQLPNSQSTASTLQGQLLSSRGDPKGALKAYLGSLAAGEDVDPTLFGAIARSALAADQASEAAQQLTDQVEKLKPDAKKNCWLAIALLQLRAKHSDEADTAFRNAIALAPADAETYSLYVGILVELKMFAKAQEVLSMGLAAGAPKSSLLLLKGWVAESAGDAGAALADYRAALDADPVSLQAANNYASLLVDRDPKNIPVLTNARNRLNGAETVADPNILDTIAWLDYRLGRYDEAKQLLEKVGAGKSENPQIRFHLGAVLLATGQRQEGLALLDGVKDLTFPGSQEARSLVAS